MDHERWHEGIHVGIHDGIFDVAAPRVDRRRSGDGCGSHIGGEVAKWRCGPEQSGPFEDSSSLFRLSADLYL